MMYLPVTANGSERFKAYPPNGSERFKEARTISNYSELIRTNWKNTSERFWTVLRYYYLYHNLSCIS